MNEAFTRHLLLPLHERLRGRSTLADVAELCQQDAMDPAVFAHYRRQKLAALLAHCQAHVPYYRQLFRTLGLDGNEPLEPETLARLPVLERDIIRARGEDLIADNYRDRVLRANTGGSSGSPLVFWTDRVKEARHNAAKLRFRRWFGVQPGDRQVDFWGSPVELDKQSRVRVWKDRYLLNQVVLSAFNLTDRRLDEYARFLGHFRPRLIYGYPSVIERVAVHVRQHADLVGGWRPRAVVCTSEMLHEPQRHLIGQTFDCPVANEYGSRDGGLIAHECPEGNLHVAADHVWVEVDQPDADGIGDLLITNLDGYGMPFLRYRVGDRGRLAGDARCACGSPLPMLARLEGRRNDFLVGGDGRLVHSLAPIYVLREIPTIRQFRLHQHSDLSLDLLLVVTEPMDESEVKVIRRKLLEALELSVSVTVTFTDRIEPERSGKYRWVRSEAIAA